MCGNVCYGKCLAFVPSSLHSHEKRTKTIHLLYLAFVIVAGLIITSESTALMIKQTQVQLSSCVQVTKEHTHDTFTFSFQVSVQLYGGPT